MGFSFLRRQRLLRAFIPAFAVTAVGCWPMFWLGVFDGPEIIGYLLGFMMLPGGMAAIVVSGNVHVFSHAVVVLVNLAVYTGIIYALLGIKSPTINSK